MVITVLSCSLQFIQCSDTWQPYDQPCACNHVSIAIRVPLTQILVADQMTFLAGQLTHSSGPVDLTGGPAVQVAELVRGPVVGWTT